MTPLLPAVSSGAPTLDTIHNVDALTLLRALPDRCVNCIVTSPPYYGLRDYNVEGQLGLEDTPQQFIANMVEIFREAKRVLRDDGTCWINMGDSYANDTKWGGKTSGKHAKGLHGTSQIGRRRHNTGLPSKSMMLIPYRLAVGLQDDGWTMRMDVIWHKPDALPETVTDRPTKAHEYVFMLTKSEHYYFDQDAIREPQTGNTHSRGTGSGHKQLKANRGTVRNNISFNKANTAYTVVPGGRNKRSVWPVYSEKLPYDHFAAFPQNLIAPMILAGCPEGGIVLDPFMGSGTTAIVTKRLNCFYIGSELNPDYIKIALQRFADPATYKVTIPPRRDLALRFPNVVQESLFQNVV